MTDETVQKVLDRLAETTAQAAEYRVRLEWAERDLGKLEARVSEVRHRRHTIERELTELRIALDDFE